MPKNRSFPRIPGPYEPPVNDHLRRDVTDTVKKMEKERDEFRALAVYAIMALPDHEIRLTPEQLAHAAEDFEIWVGHDTSVGGVTVRVQPRPVYPARPTAAARFAHDV